MLNRSARRRIRLAFKRRANDPDPAYAQGESNAHPAAEKPNAGSTTSAIGVTAGPERRNKSGQNGHDPEHVANEASVAKSTRTIARLTAALVFVGVLSACVSCCQWREMVGSGIQADKLIAANVKLASAAKNSADTAAKNLMASQRPWIVTTDLSVISLEITKDDVSDLAKVNFRNAGNSPALRLNISSKLAADSNSFGLAVQRKVCEAARVDRGNQAIDNTVFPQAGSQYMETFATAKDKDIIRDNRDLAIKLLPKEFKFVMTDRDALRSALNLIGCFTYLTTIDDLAVIHNSSFGFRITTPGPPGETVIDLNTPRTIKGSDLIWTAYNGGTFAD